MKTQNNTSEFQIKWYSPTHNFMKPHFFILSRGMNAGKPGHTPWRNSFVCYADDPELVQQLYYVFFALWTGKKFHAIIFGTAIPLIRLEETRELIQEHWDKLMQKERPADLFTRAKSLDQLSNLIEVQSQKIKLLGQLKVAKAREFFQ
jgi:hypothetical protein